MSAVGKFLKPVASFGASLIPGVGAIAGPAVGAALGALGSSGKQGGVKQQSTSQQTVDELQETLEPDYFSQFRKQLIPAYMQELERAQGPIYGDAQKAAVLNDANDLARSAGQSAMGMLSGMGRLNSGAADQAVSDIQTQRFGNLSNFFSQLPFMENEARFNRMSNLLGMGANWAGRAPTSMRQTGTRGMTSSGNTTNEGPGFWRSLASGAAGQLAASDWAQKGYQWPWQKKPPGFYTPPFNPNAEMDQAAYGK